MKDAKSVTESAKVHCSFAKQQVFADMIIEVKQMTDKKRDMSDNPYLLLISNGINLLTSGMGSLYHTKAVK